MAGCGSDDVPAVRPGQTEPRHEAAFDAARASDDLRIEASGRAWRYDTPGILYIRTALQHSYIDLATGTRADFNSADTTLTIDHIPFDADATHTLRTTATTTTYALTNPSDTAIIVLDRH